MPKPKYDYTAFSIKKLLEEVSNKSKTEINNLANCSTLSEVLSKENIIVSKDTIARLYKLRPTKSLPAKYTLDSLSAYLGHQHWKDFYLKFRKESENNSIINDIKSDIINDSTLMFMKFCIEDSQFNPIINFLKTIIPNISDPFGNDAKKIADIIGKTSRINPEVRKQIIPEITKNKQLRDAVFTWWVDIDGLNAYYADMIKINYIKDLNRLDADFLQNELWAYSMLMHNAFYNQNIKEFTKNAYYLFTKYTSEQISLQDGIAPFPFARYHSNHILYQYFYNPKTSIIWYEQKIKFIKDQLNLTTEHEKVIILAFTIEALAVAGKYSLVLDFADEYHSAVSGFINNNKIVREEDSLIKLIYYYNLALKKLNNLNEDFKPVIVDISGTEKYIAYQQNFSYFHKSAISLFENEERQKNQYLSEAKKHAQAINNKFYLSQICKEKRL